MTISNKLWKLLSIAAVAMTALVTTASVAHAGPVNQFLTGGVVDPNATTMRVVPPRGGMVVLHQNGQAVAWFMRTGFVNLRPNRIYSVTATRGSSMLFNANVMARRGFTELVWSNGNQPQMNFVPAFGPGFRQPAFAGGRRAPSSRARMPGNTHRLFVNRMRKARTDGERWRTMNRFTSPLRQALHHEREPKAQPHAHLQDNKLPSQSRACSQREEGAAPAGHQARARHHDQAPGHHDQAPGHHDQAPGHTDKASRTDQSQSCSREAPRNAVEAPRNNEAPHAAQAVGRGPQPLDEELRTGGAWWAQQDLNL